MTPGTIGWGVTPLAVVLVVSGTLTSILVRLVWQQRPKSGSRAVAAATATMAAWAFGQALLVGARTEIAGLAGVYLTLIGLSCIGPFWVVAAFQYTGREMTRGLLAAVVVEPIVFLALLTTNAGHGLVFEDVRRVGEVGFAYGVGPGTLAHYLYSYAILLWADWLLFEKFLASRNVYRKRTFVLLLVNVVPVGAHAVSVVGFSPLPDTSLGPALFLVLAVLSLLILVSDRFLMALPVERVLGLVSGHSKSLEPIARDTAIEQLGAGFVVLDHRNRIVDLNPMGKRILGIDDQRVVGKQISDIVPPELFEDAPFLDSGTTGEYNGIWVETDADQHRCYDVLITPLATDGEQRGRIGLINDVTERERRKRKLQARTAELERQNEQLEGVANVISHDLRNPLSVAEGHLELAEDDEHVGTARQAVSRMGSIVEDVLTLATHGQSINEVESVHLGHLARDAWETAETGAASLVVEVDRHVEGDRSRLRQLFENLYRNSVEHGSTGNRTQSGDSVEHGSADDRTGSGNGQQAENGTHGSEGVTVTVGPLSDGFYVADDGEGIPADKRERVFEEGYTNRESGTGLGLSIVATIVDAHGWEITATESDAGGARFEVTGVERSHAPEYRVPERQ